LHKSLLHKYCISNNIISYNSYISRPLQYTSPYILHTYRYSSYILAPASTS
jgi:hypothetical protein